MFLATCNHCERQFRVADENRGLELPCPACKVRQRVEMPLREGRPDVYQLADDKPARAPSPEPPSPDLHAPVDLGGPDVPSPRRRVPAKTSHKLPVAWLGAIAAVLVVAVGWMAHVLMEQPSAAEPTDNTPAGMDHAAVTDVPQSPAPRQAAAAPTGPSASTHPAQSPASPAETEGTARAVVAGEPGKWDGLAGVTWDMRLGEFANVKQDDRQASMFGSTLTRYTQTEGLGRFAGMEILEMTFGFRGRELREISLVSASPSAVGSWLKEQFGPSHSQGLFEGVECWVGESAIGGGTVQIEYAPRGVDFPCTVRMKLLPKG